MGTRDNDGDSSYVYSVQIGTVTKWEGNAIAMCEEG